VEIKIKYLKMQIIEVIQVGGLEGYTIRLGKNNKYYLYSNDVVCVSKGKATIDEVRSIIRCQDPTLYSLEDKAKKEAKELIHSFDNLVDSEIDGEEGFVFSYDKKIENCKKCALIVVDKTLSVLYEIKNEYYYYLLVKAEIKKYSTLRT
jgi:hypothetical protein